MKSPLILQSPAKTNLYLRVLGRRPDGYHNISTVFQRVDLCDTISFTRRSGSGIRIHCDHPDVPTGPGNLIAKAIKTLFGQYDIRDGIEIRLKKRIPVAAGLAGGSTNAATAIFAVNRMWKLGLSRAQMCEIGARIGSDVPFFLMDCSFAHGTGRGEILSPVRTPLKLWQVIVTPRIKLTSGSVYQGLNLKLTKVRDDANILIRNLKIKNLNKIGQFLVNDLEAPIVRRCPQLEKLKTRLSEAGATGSLISGSGPSVFGMAGNQRQAEQLKEQLSRRFSQVFVVRTF